MTNERTAMMEKARAKRKRHAEAKMPKNLPANLQGTDPTASFAEKVLDLAEGAVAHVGELVKAAAAKLSSGDQHEIPGKS